jgi:hypothetical protein
METSAVGSSSMASPPVQQPQRAAAVDSAESTRAQQLQQQPGQKTEPARPVTNMQGQRTGTVVNTTA